MNEATFGEYVEVGASSSVTGSRFSVMMLSELTVMPNNRLAMFATAALRSLADPSDAMVADVPMQRMFSLNLSRTRRTSMATSAVGIDRSVWLPRLNGTKESYFQGWDLS